MGTDIASVKAKPRVELRRVHLQVAMAVAHCITVQETSHESMALLSLAVLTGSTEGSSLQTQTQGSLLPKPPLLGA